MDTAVVTRGGTLAPLFTLTVCDFYGHFTTFELQKNQVLTGCGRDRPIHAKMVASFTPEVAESALAYAFDILKSVSWSAERNWKGNAFTTNTRWSIVYEPHQLRIHFRTHANPAIRVIDLNAFDFSCATPVKTLEINAEPSGDVSEKFVDHTRQSNRRLIEDAFTKTVFLPRFSAEKLDQLTAYPDTIKCGE
jgi:hypothetical protein